jgi:hypothetical protein
MHRDQCHAATELCLTKNKRENGNEEINLCDPKQLVPVGAVQFQKLGQNLRRVVLAPVGIVRIPGIYGTVDAIAARIEAVADRLGQVVDNALVNNSNRHYLDLGDSHLCFISGLTESG